MQRRKLNLLAAVGAALALAASPAIADKANDTLRIAISDPFSAIDSYHVPHDEVGYFARNIYGKLVVFDEYKGKFRAEIAKSWKRINDTTLEFELRDDVVFHSGNKFTAEDVKYTIGYIGHPKVRIRFKGRYNWVKEAQILGPHKLRIVSKKPKATDMSTIAYRFHMFDSKIHSTLKNKSDYGRVSASSTGPYRMVSINKNTGPRVERFDKFFGSKYRRAPIKRIHGIPMPDRQTQIAQLFTGGVDVLRKISSDAILGLRKRPGVMITPTSSKLLMYLWFDGLGRSGKNFFKDVRVRKAAIMAINRKQLMKYAVAGGEAAELPKSICFERTVACAPTTSPYKYNPAMAKKLLAEAGYPNGFDVTLTVFNPIKEIGEAIAGDLLKVGIRASIRPLALFAYVRERGAGKLTLFNGYYPTAAQPDTENLLNFFFGANRDYWKDPLVHKARKAGSTIFDLKKRTQTYVDALNRINEMAYIFPVAELPNVYAHTKDVQLKPNLISAGETRLGDFFWK